jgi:glycosyltransferase involved in cell wall biosynthesis
MNFVYVVNSSEFFCSHFMNLAINLKADFGCEVHIISGDKVKEMQLRGEGFMFHYLPLSRKGVNPFYEAFTLLKLRALLGLIKPDVIHSFTIKPIIYTGLASFFSFGYVKRKIYSVTGLGSLFLSEKLFNVFLWEIVTILYRLSFRSSNTRVFFENNDDRDLFVEQKIVPFDKTLLVNGAGIDTEHFKPSERLYKGGNLVVTYVGRLLKDKGVRELIEAASEINRMGLDIQFLVVGNIDVNNISSLTLDEVVLAHEKGYINYLGTRGDINLIYKDSDVACLPSYREGLPKSLIEASASGCAILTTDTPGCRQMIHEQKNGMLFEIQSSESIVEKIVFLYKNPDILNAMKIESRRISLEKYGHSLINRTFFDGYGI